MLVTSNPQDFGESINQIFFRGVLLFWILRRIWLTDWQRKVNQKLDLGLHNSKCNIRNSNHCFTEQIVLDGSHLFTFFPIGRISWISDIKWLSNISLERMMGSIISSGNLFKCHLIIRKKKKKNSWCEPSLFSLEPRTPFLTHTGHRKQLPSLSLFNKPSSNFSSSG